MFKRKMVKKVRRIPPEEMPGPLERAQPMSIDVDQDTGAIRQTPASVAEDYLAQQGKTAETLMQKSHPTRHPDDDGSMPGAY